MGRKIDEIMNLYNVSLRAAEVDNATAAASRDKLLEINSKKAEAGSMDIEKIGKGEKDRGGDGNVLNDALQVEACAGNSKDLSKAHDMQLSGGHSQHRQEAEQQGFECHASLMVSTVLYPFHGFVEMPTYLAYLMTRFQLFPFPHAGGLPTLLSRGYHS